jgi:hypothetical protein
VVGSTQISERLTGDSFSFFGSGPKTVTGTLQSGALHVSGTFGAISGHVQSTFGVGTASPTSTLHVAGTFAAQGVGLFGSQVGINVASPTATLHVTGSAQISERLTGDAFSFGSTGPYVIGSLSTDTTSLLKVTGTFTGTGNAFGVNASAFSLTPAVGGDGALVFLGGTLVEAGSGTHPDMVGLQIGTPSLSTGGGASTTNASSLKINGAPTGATNNYALWVDAGLSRFDGFFTHPDNHEQGSDRSLLWSVDANNNETDRSFQWFANRSMTTGGGTELMRLSEAGALLLGDTSNADITVGFTANQGASDDQIFALKSSDVAHGSTSNAETDTYGYMSKLTDIGGALLISGISDADTTVAVGLAMLGVSGIVANTTKTTAGRGVIELDGKIVSGTGDAAVGSTGNLVVFRNRASTTHIFEASGDIIIPNTAILRGINAAASSTISMVSVNASNRLVLFGTHVWPAADGTSGQVLQTDGSGNLSFSSPAYSTVISALDRDTSTNDVVSTASETTVYTFSVPANTLGSTRALRLTMIGDYLHNPGAGTTLVVRVKYGATTIMTFSPASMATNANRRALNLYGTLSANNGTGAQVFEGRLIISQPSGATGTAQVEDATSASQIVGTHNSIAEDSTAAKTFSITFQHGASDANASARALAVQLELI